MDNTRGRNPSYVLTEHVPSGQTLIIRGVKPSVSKRMKCKKSQRELQPENEALQSWLGRVMGVEPREAPSFGVLCLQPLHNALPPKRFQSPLCARSYYAPLSNSPQKRGYAEADGKPYSGLVAMRHSLLCLATWAARLRKMRSGLDPC